MSEPLPLRSEPFDLDDVIVGTSPLGGIGKSLGDENAIEIVARCVEVGFREFDTAPLYGLGSAEVRLGEGLRRGAARATTSDERAKRLLRDEIRVWTKVGRVMKARDALVEGDEVEEANVPGAPGMIYSDCPDVVPVLDYTAKGVMASWDDSMGRLGDDIVLAGLRCHDPETPELEKAALKGSLPGLGNLRANINGPWSDHPAPMMVGLGLNDAGVAARILDETNPPSGTPPPHALDALMLAGRWHLLEQSGAAVLATCAARGIQVHVAGIYASGLLAGGSTYEYRPATAAHLAKRDAWASLCATHGVSLKAAAVAFAFLPAAVDRVAVGIGEAAFVDETVSLVAAAAAVPAALWTAAVAEGLLAPDVLALGAVAAPPAKRRKVDGEGGDDDS
mmetsp:Transcript_32636/g.100537  ORF Transcript_32636/g.100537 Transcript_32636/m.100537 type:complete len:393 (-) Transcript_32636:68-1246(-)